MTSLVMRAAVLAAACAIGMSTAVAQEPFYKGKRLTLLINFAAGGPTDIEGRLLAKHIVKHIDGQPQIIVQNRDGAGGLVGTNYVGEVGPRDGSMFGYFTGAAWKYVMEPEKHTVDFRTFEFVGYQPGSAVYYVRSDTPPGLKNAADILKAQGVVAGGLAVESSKDLLIRLTLDMLGVPHKYITGFRSSVNARLAVQRGEIHLHSEFDARLLLGGRAEPGEDRHGGPALLRFLLRRRDVHGAAGDGDLDDPAVPGILPQGPRRRTEGSALGRLSHQSRRRLRDAADDRDAAGRAAGGAGARCAPRSRASTTTRNMRQTR